MSTIALQTFNMFLFESNIVIKKIFTSQLFQYFYQSILEQYQDFAQTLQRIDPSLMLNRLILVICFYLNLYWNYEHIQAVVVHSGYIIIKVLGIVLLINLVTFYVKLMMLSNECISCVKQNVTKEQIYDNFNGVND